MAQRNTPRDLDTLANEGLFKLARDLKATRRMEAVRILIQRCSPFIRRPELADLVERYLADEPEKIKQHG